MKNRSKGDPVGDCKGNDVKKLRELIDKNNTIKDKLNNARSMTNAYDMKAFEVSGAKTVCDEFLHEDFMKSEEEMDLEE